MGGFSLKLLVITLLKENIFCEPINTLVLTIVDSGRNLLDALSSNIFFQAKHFTVNQCLVLLGRKVLLWKNDPSQYA